jgi:hypothetical protein
MHKSGAKNIHGNISLAVHYKSCSLYLILGSQGQIPGRKKILEVRRSYALSKHLLLKRFKLKLIQLGGNKNLRRLE